MDIPLNARVDCADGRIGRVGAVVEDETSGQATHFVLQEGHLWGKKEVTLPLSAIDRVEGDRMPLTSIPLTFSGG